MDKSNSLSNGALIEHFEEEENYEQNYKQKNHYLNCKVNVWNSYWWPNGTGKSEV